MVSAPPVSSATLRTDPSNGGTQAEHAYRGTVLAVDDRPRNVQLLATILGGEGYEVICATSGAQALSCVAAKVPDLILLDVMMPEMDGFEVCRRLKHDARTADIAVIFLSAADDKNTIVRGIECGGVDYVTKPFTKEELLARVGTHVAMQHLRERHRRLLQNRHQLITEEMEELKRPLRAIASKLEAIATAEPPATERVAKLLREAITLTSDALCHVSRDIAEPLSEGRENSLDYPVSFRQLQEFIGQWYLSARRRNLGFKMGRVSMDVQLACNLSPLKYLIDLVLSAALNASKTGDSIHIAMQRAEQTLDVWIEHATQHESRSFGLNHGNEIQWFEPSAHELQLTRGAERIGATLRTGARPNQAQVILLSLPLHEAAGQ